MQAEEELPERQRQQLVPLLAPWQASDKSDYVPQKVVDRLEEEKSEEKRQVLL